MTAHFIVLRITCQLLVKILTMKSQAITLIKKLGCPMGIPVFLITS